jgi:hypothetical protein
MPGKPGRLTSCGTVDLARTAATHTSTMNRLFPTAACAALCLLAAPGCQQFSLFYNNLTGNTPGKYARLMEESSSPDARRIGINGLVAQPFARQKPYTTRYREIALNDPDAQVRATAVRALNRADDATATDVYVKALSDPSDLVRLEGAKALIQMPNEAAVAPLLAIMGRADEPKDVRIAAAAALKHYPRTDVARALAATLGERDFSVAWQARRSLKRLTGGQDFAYDEAAWLQYITGPDKPFG